MRVRRWRKRAREKETWVKRGLCIVGNTAGDTAGDMSTE